MWSTKFPKWHRICQAWMIKFKIWRPIVGHVLKPLNLASHYMTQGKRSKLICYFLFKENLQKDMFLKIFPCFKELLIKKYRYFVPYQRRFFFISKGPSRIYPEQFFKQKTLRYFNIENIFSLFSKNFQEMTKREKGREGTFYPILETLADQKGLPRFFNYFLPMEGLSLKTFI